MRRGKSRTPTDHELPRGCPGGALAVSTLGIKERQDGRPPDLATPRGRHATAALVTGERRCRMRGVGEYRHGYESNRCHACGSPRRKQASACRWWRLDGAILRLQSSLVGRWVATTFSTPPTLCNPRRFSMKARCSLGKQAAKRDLPRADRSVRLTVMRYEYKHVAKMRFQTLPASQRHAAAEEWLVRRALNVESSAGWFVEVGAHHPTQFSQTWHLAKVGWSGLLVEPQPAFVEKLRAARPESVVEQVACGGPNTPEFAALTVPEKSAHATLDKRGIAGMGEVLSHIEVRVCTLNALLEKHARQVDFMSIDVEGFTSEVLDGLDLNVWRPRLLLIEDNLHDFRSHWHPTIRNAGYRLVKRTGVNSWYVPADSPFQLTGWRERFKLRLKLLRTPTRRLATRFRDFIRRICYQGDRHISPKSSLP